MKAFLKLERFSLICRLICWWFESHLDPLDSQNKRKQHVKEHYQRCLALARIGHSQCITNTDQCIKSKVTKAKHESKNVCKRARQHTHRHKHTQNKNSKAARHINSSVRLLGWYFNLKPKSLALSAAEPPTLFFFCLSAICKRFSRREAVQIGPAQRAERQLQRGVCDCQKHFLMASSFLALIAITAYCKGFHRRETANRDISSASWYVLYVCVCLRVCVYVCACVYAWVWVYACVCERVYVSLSI